MIYTNFAYIYDKLMYDVDYSKWADYVESIVRSNGIDPRLVLDLGCGTGSFCIQMARRGWDMIGIDVSEDMLSCARAKTENEGLDILFLNQDMAEFELYGTVDVIVCLMDSINYITRKNDVKKVFKLVRNYLNPGGLFIFDINTPYKLEKVLGSNVFYDIGEDITYIWQNDYDRSRKICRFDLTFFIRHGESFMKYDEIHEERSYSPAEIKEMLKDAGLKLIKTYDELSFFSPSDKSERVFFVCKK